MCSGCCRSCSTTSCTAACCPSRSSPIACRSPRPPAAISCSTGRSRAAVRWCCCPEPDRTRGGGARPLAAGPRRGPDVRPAFLRCAWLRPSAARRCSLPTMASTRIEVDSFGPIRVAASRLWGAQTQRSLANFPIGDDRFPRAFIRALGIVKKCALLANAELGELAMLNRRQQRAVVRAADEVIGGRWDDHFPLVVWQTGSGTQTNMNANEVIANRAIQILGGRLGARTPIHPNDHVNRGQSSNDVFPSALHIAVAEETERRLLPAVIGLAGELDRRAKAWRRLVK